MSVKAREETINSTTFARNLGEYMDKVRGGEVTVIVHAHGRRHVVMLPVYVYDELIEARRELKRLRHEGMGGMQ